jgi:serine/threonine protein kinase
LSGSTSSHPPLEDGARAAHDLADRVRSLVRAWQGGTPPVLADLLPPPDDPLRRLALVELIKADLRLRGRRRSPRRLADYLAEFPELPPDELPVDLIYEELHQRRLAGETVETGDYFRRYPAQAEALARLLDQGRATHSTAVLTPDDPIDVHAGDKLDDFDLLAPLGEGTFAKVFLAWQRSMARRVALKVSADRGGEPQALAQLDHPGIVRVYDQRVLPGRELRLLYMSYVPGGTLQDVLNRLRARPQERPSGRTLLEVIDGVLAARNESAPADSVSRRWLAGQPWPVAVCWLGARLAEALDHAHRQGVLHRDVKPANVLLAADGSPMLADFNVGCFTKLDGAGPAALFGGSLPYMAPEQLEAFNPLHERRPESVDARSDQYALALTLWELLTGRLPFPGGDMGRDWYLTLSAMTARRRAGLPADAGRALPRDCPPGLEAALRRCLEPDPGARFASAAELASELRLCLKPRTRALLRPAPGGWGDVVRRWPLLSMYPAGIAPNAVAAGLSILYNQSAIIEPTHSQEVAIGFYRLIGLINATFFPLGMIAFAVVAWPVVGGLRRLRRGEELPPADRQRRRLRCLRLGTGLGVICVAAWVVAGALFPLLLRLGPGQFVHFIISQALCGAMAVAYPFFAVNFLAVRYIYPAFLRPEADGPSEADAGALDGLGRAVNLNLALAAMVPLLGVAAVALVGSASQWALVVLSVAGLLGFGQAVDLARRINDDRRALEAAVRPPGREE